MLKKNWKLAMSVKLSMSQLHTSLQDKVSISDS